MRILISGGSGFIGQALEKTLTSRGDQVVIWSRQSSSKTNWVKQLDDIKEPIDAVINLAGAGIVDKRWSPERKQLLRDSRIQTTKSLVEWMAKQQQQPKTLISGSAIGYYGSQASGELDENSTPIKGFTHQLCADWEAEALKAEALGVRVCLIRTGVVLGAKEGALKKMLPPFRFGLGGPIASGKQWMSWIHIDDEVAAIGWLLDRPELSGPFNLTAPEPVTNEVFSKTLGKALHRPAFFRVPAFTMKLMLGEASELLLEGQCVKPVALTKSGFSFNYPRLESALKNLV
ncbi:TIGR01777 family oxidoreductase [Nitrincola schmidtii]|uniref:TIGR01777 family oxidoreductase n=1 Tax=Nitrincola schmidtii TaxID=1730894 RepID=UPI00124D9E6C|nr:TIGR01777 family oxidoreductase [Nitrincola schmidtii]